MSNIIKFGGSGSGGSSISAPIIGKDFNWTGGDGYPHPNVYQGTNGGESSAFN